MSTRNPDNPEPGAGHTATEELLIRALAARAEQIGPHSLRPGTPPAPNWAARGRGPLVFALAAAVAGTALVSASLVTMLGQPDRDSAAKTPPTVSTATVPPSQPVTAGPTESAPPGPGNPSGPASPSSPSNTSVSRSVTVTYGPANSTLTLRTGQTFAALTAKVDNGEAEVLENVSEMLTVKADGGTGTLEAGDISVSLRDPGTGAWQPVGGIGSAGYEAALAGSGGADLAAGSSRTHQIRISLGSSFPAGITRLKIELFSGAGQETLTVTG
jgi:hypothetical protein